MEKQQIIGIRRDSHFSPNHIGNDRIIFDRVTASLTVYGFNVSVYNEDEFVEMQYDAPIAGIVSMGRNKRLVANLQAYERHGVPVFNSAFGVANCYRVSMVRGLLSAGIPHPKSVIISTTDDSTPFYHELGAKGVWVKRGDFHAIHREDVSYAASSDECKHILNEYALRGIESAVICEHLTGDLVKFYGVRGSGFFYWFYPYDNHHHKFTEYQQVNGPSAHYAFDERLLKAMAERAADALGVHIYGGDAIVGPDGRFHIIDLNDWPSFAPCREAAAKAIAGFLAASLISENTNQLDRHRLWERR